MLVVLFGSSGCHQECSLPVGNQKFLYGVCGIFNNPVVVFIQRFQCGLSPFFGIVVGAQVCFFRWEEGFDNPN